MEKLTNSELLRLSASVFEYYPEEDTLLATTDGNFFLPQADHHASNHAKAFGLEVVKISREDILNLPSAMQNQNLNPGSGVENSKVEKNSADENQLKDHTANTTTNKRKNKQITQNSINHE